MKALHVHVFESIYAKADEKIYGSLYNCRVHVYTFHNIYIIYMISLLLFFSLILNMHSAIDWQHIELNV